MNRLEPRAVTASNSGFQLPLTEQTLRDLFTKPADLAGLIEREAAPALRRAQVLLEHLQALALRLFGVGVLGRHFWIGTPAMALSAG